MNTLQEDNDQKPERILTQNQRAQRMAAASPLASSGAREIIGDSAAVFSNRWRNPETGRDQWMPDTPDWIRAIPRQRAWFHAADYDEIERRTTKPARGGDRS